ncbi:MAG: glycosyltransferase [Acidobacteriaceae bacterium]
MRIHHLLNSFETGGAEMLVAAMAPAQMRAGHEVVVHAMSGVGAISEALTRAGVPFRCHLARHPLHRIRQVARSLRRDFDRPDVMHCHNLAPLIVGGAAARLARVPVSVVTRHHPAKDDQQERKFWRAAKITSCARVIACSELVRSSMAQHSFADLRKLTMIANGCGEPNCESQGEPLGEKQGVRLITVGRLVWEKDYPTLINAFALARQAIPALELWIAGDGIERTRIESVIAAADLDASVKLLGMKKNVGYYLQQCDIFVLSSVSEGLPVSQLEAMAAGLPMIVTDVGGMPDIINQSGAGMIVPKSNPAALSEAILKMAGDPDALKTMGAKARATYQRDYTIERMCGDYERLYRECLPLPAAARHR